MSARTSPEDQGGSSSGGGLRRFFRRISLPRSERAEPRLGAVDQRVAKEYVKRRLAALYPELRVDPAALERAYAELGLEPRGTAQRSGAEVKAFALRVDAAVPGAFAHR